MRELWADAPMARPAVDDACVARLVAMLDACTDAERRAAAQAIAQAEEARRRAAAAQAEAGVVAQAQHDAGARALEALAAAEGCPVQELLAAGDLSFRNLDAAVVADGLRHLLTANGSLKVLDLRDNKLTDAAALALADVLKVNGSLTTLRLISDQIGDAGKEAVRIAWLSKTGRQEASLHL
ncbi:hypothetical protein T492DRAFT_154281 [Pavlovales sp. CCMP2436]|nr:hypothetical protein T492DRAFT_154281 [Pavlovales sp. CCMP2436]